MRCTSEVHENQVDFSPPIRLLCPSGSLRHCLMNDYSMSNYKQGALFTRSAAANENGCAFNGPTLPTPEILSDGNHELRTRTGKHYANPPSSVLPSPPPLPLSPLNLSVTTRHRSDSLLVAELHSSRLPPLLRIGRSRALLTRFR